MKSNVTLKCAVIAVWLIGEGAAFQSSAVIILHPRERFRRQQCCVFYINKHGNLGTDRVSVCGEN